MARIPYVRSLFRASGAAVVRFKDGFALGMPNVAVLPTASLANRGSILRVEGVDGVGDTLYICTKSAADQYQWIPFFGTATGTTFFFEDHFVGGTKGLMGWETSGTGGTTTIEGALGRPGILVLETGGTSGNNRRLYLGDSVTSGSVSSADEWDMTFVVKPTTVTSCSCRVGINGDWSTNAPTDWMGFEFDSATDTNWMYVTRNASTSTRTDSGVAYTTTSWYRLRMRRVNTGTDTIHFSIKVAGGVTTAETAQTTNLDGGPDSPGFYLRTANGTTKLLSIDYFSLLMTGLSV